MDVVFDSTCQDVDAEAIINDKKLQKKINKQGVAVLVNPGNGTKSEIVVFTTEPRNLSGNMPILTNLGFGIESEIAFEIKTESQSLFGRKYFIEKESCARLEEVSQNLEAITEETIRGLAKNSPLNSLAFLINLSPRQIKLVTAIASYEKQLIRNLAESTVHEVMIKHADVVRQFCDYFELKFKPDTKNRMTRLKKLRQEISDSIKSVGNITEDRVLKIFMGILDAATRTNYFSYGHEVFDSRALAIKVEVEQLYDYLSGIQPRIEIFVYHNHMQGVHLRRTNVSRGGLRWSDRFEDYRDEIRLLMQAQRQKNSIIVPSGAKGGFVITEGEGQRPSKERFETFYRMFIEALLDMVDNRTEGKVVQPEDLVAYDKPDSYFVVAADKGTASMSDVANEISEMRKFWMGDAFASGGSRGYSHKEMGITAKGSIKSVERFFIDQGVDFHTQSISVVGIGSPAGDVFGNGIQLSHQFCLIAAVSSRYIFIDPDPDLEKAYVERQRLFEEGLGWEHYNPDLISSGGGVYRKDDKEIHLSAEARKLLGIKKEVINGEELTRDVLSTKVDMLFNGGVGTYVRSSHESDTEIGDKPNESVRVTAKDIKALTVCEGGNLGFTQKARMEFAKRGGRITCDSIDNSAGVQTSDNEVNLKITLDNLVKKGIVEADKRDAILFEQIPSVEQTVLWTNYLQALALSQDESRSIEDLGRFKQTLQVLEENVSRFNRYAYDLPGPDEYAQVLCKNGALPRPMLAVMLSFAKTFVKYELLKHPELLDSEFGLRCLYKYFPKNFVAVYKNAIEEHPLRREIIATYIANKVINFQGCSFIHDYAKLGRDKFLFKIKAFLAVNTLVSANDIRFEIYRHDYKVPVKKQYELLFEIEESVEFLVNWVVERGEYETSLFDHLMEYRNALYIFITTTDIPHMRQIAPDSEHLNRFFSMIDYVRMALTIISVKESTHRDFCEVAELFYKVSQELDIVFLTNNIKNLIPNSEWEERLKEELEKEVIESVYQIIELIIEFKRSNESIETAYREFIRLNQDIYRDYTEDLRLLKAMSGDDPVMIAVIVKSLRKMTHAHK